MIGIDQLIPGDLLVYGRTPFNRSPVGWFFGFVINKKTWDDSCHVEVYDGDSYSLASRDGVGVGRYPFRESELIEVRRPSALHYNHAMGQAWFKTVSGQKYDWVGLLSFGLNKTKAFLMSLLRMTQEQMQFCSEYATRHYRKGGLELFNPDFDADRTAPAQLRQTPNLTTIWKHDQAETS